MLNRRLVKAAATAAALVIGCAGLALAQRDDEGEDRYRASPRSQDDSAEGRRNVAGEFDYYALVLSWSPTHCAESTGDRDEMQCARRDGRRYAFILHGLWPQYERGYPESCATRRRPFVPQPVIDGMLDIMPSTGLVIHEYKKHGTCSGQEPQSYFTLARRLFGKIKVPNKYMNPFESQFVAPDDLADDFLDANPDLKPEMIAVACGGPGNRLKEVRICFGRDGTPRACGANESQRRLCSAQKMFVPPVRSSKTQPETEGERNKAKPPSPLPMPRLLPEPRSL